MGKLPPSSRNVVPRRGAGDYEEEEATTLDPFSIHESELVVIPKGGTDSIREDLRADPDVQDALRWLDPPSNVGPSAPVQTSAEPPPVEYAPPAEHAPPVRHPSAPPFAQVYTPLPQPYAGAGPYPTPVPGFVPNSGAYYLVTPMPAPQPPPAPAGRSPILWILLTAMVTGGGIALGWWMFALRDKSSGAEPSRQPAKVAPQPQPQPPAPVPPQPIAPAVQPEATPPPAAASVTATIKSLTASSSVSIMAPMSGQVSKVFLAEPGTVAKGDKLIQIRYESGGANAKKLAARVAELEALAKDDPVYADFLEEARKQQKAARGKTQSTIVMATAAGRARLTLKQGASVSAGSPVAVLETGGDWVVKATAQAEVQRSWTCGIELPDGKRADCRIDKVVATASGSDITAKVRSKDAPWLEGVAQNPTLVLAPP